MCAAADSERRNELEEGGMACSVIVCDIDPKVPGVKDGKVGKFNKVFYLDGSQWRKFPFPFTSTVKVY